MIRRKAQRSVSNAGSHNMHPPAGRSHKNDAQTAGENARDLKGRKGQYGAAGDSPLTKK